MIAERLSMKERQQDFRFLESSLKKQKIIKTAAELFHKKGYKSTTLDDVAEALGVTKAALYHYVKSKDSLLSVIFMQASENIFRNAHDISIMELAPDEKLRRIVRSHIENIISKDLSMVSVFFSEETQLPEKDLKKIREQKKIYTIIIEKIIEEGIAEKIFKATDAKLLTYGLLGMCNWVHKWFKPKKTAYKAEQIADYFVSLLEKGCVLTDQGTLKTCATCKWQIIDPSNPSQGQCTIKRNEMGAIWKRRIRDVHHMTCGKHEEGNQTFVENTSRLQLDTFLS
jgi:TetR/AcrR family transcriptional regulator, cholesterol catabolism regulator